MKTAPGEGGGEVGGGGAEEEGIDGDFPRLGVGDDGENAFVDAHEALGMGCLCGWADGAEAGGGVRGAFGDDDAVAGDGESGVDAEDRDWA